jgi:hypothetical protein
VKWGENCKPGETSTWTRTPVAPTTHDFSKGGVSGVSSDGQRGVAPDVARKYTQQEGGADLDATLDGLAVVGVPKDNFRGGGLLIR